MDVYIQVVPSYGPNIIFHFLVNEMDDMQETIISMFTTNIFDEEVHLCHEKINSEMYKFGYTVSNNIIYSIFYLEMLQFIIKPIDIVVMPSLYGDELTQIDKWINIIKTTMILHHQRYIY